jgi:hypothetical protein
MRILHALIMVVPRAIHLSLACQAFVLIFDNESRGCGVNKMLSTAIILFNMESNFNGVVVTISNIRVADCEAS